MALGGLAVSAPPALADMPRDQEERGVYISLGGHREQISNLDVRLASDASGGKGARIEFDRGGEAHYQVGWLLPERKGAVALTYWELADSQGNGERGGTFIPTEISHGTTPRSRVEGRARVLARSVDADYRRDFNAEHSDFRATWTLGLRYFRYEHELVSEYYAGVQIADQAIEEVDSTGVGPRVGASFQYYWGRRWSLAGGLGVATLFGSSDHRNYSRINMTTVANTAVREQRGQSRTFSQLDLDMHVVFVAWKGLDVTGGYRVAHWYDTRTRAGFSDEFSIERVTFDGPYLAVGYRF